MQLFPALPEVVRGMFRRPEALAVCPPGGGPRERGMFLNQTANYGLSQWEATDRILMEDFNTDNSKIDAALAGLDTRAAALEAAAGGFGNCLVYTTSYVGGGTRAPKTMSFPEKPLLVMVANQQDGYCFVACRGMAEVYPHHSSGTAKITLTWADKALTWHYADLTNVNMDEKGDTYQILALLEKNA